jgi:hypothetical protein
MTPGTSSRVRLCSIVRTVVARRMNDVSTNVPTKVRTDADVLRVLQACAVLHLFPRRVATIGRPADSAANLSADASGFLKLLERQTEDCSAVRFVCSRTDTSADSLLQVSRRE